MNLSIRVVTVYNEHTQGHTQGVLKMGGNAIHVSEKNKDTKRNYGCKHNRSYYGVMNYLLNTNFCGFMVEQINKI